ncbi:MAG: hypothetical protein HYV61_07280 [Candidatus Rokubacteria bacterium]|nr:hypothetical protein [Candidatus Rokubacteria bacterium]MBI2879013.1 hypothetical protein [Candidatus Rokubacteria bacterium]
MHDGVFFEDQGRPTATIATTEFVKAARAQAEALGLPAFRVVALPHPIQPLTEAEVRALADKAWDEIVERLTRPA